MSLRINSGTTLILGGARSGKSRYGEELILSSGLNPIYLATGRALDQEMEDRIHVHQERRGKEWETVEEPLALPDALKETAHPGRAILVDCLTMWVTNLMMAGADVQKESDALVAVLPKLETPVVFVSDEVGLGIIPDNKLAREFRDLAGLVNQKLAAHCDEAIFIAAGLPMVLKGPN